jgi:hypothetical protein
MAIYRPGDNVVVRILGEGVALGRIMAVQGVYGKRAFKIETLGLEKYRNKDGALWIGEAEIGFV